MGIIIFLESESLPGTALTKIKRYIRFLFNIFNPDLPSSRVNHLINEITSIGMGLSRNVENKGVSNDNAFTYDIDRFSHRAYWK
tara:strand:+ start:26421 stop:26672 length:252 start_codon:yes stop_codon:yes gene_type:complete